MKIRIALIKVIAVMAGTIFLSAAGWGNPPAAVFDTSYALEASASCLSGGCHETNPVLVDGYAQSYMTHVMVKCNACHGTHTAAELGMPKPNITGYFSGIGATGYVVGKDRCLACHSAVQNRGGHPRNPNECVSCHAPHAFAK
jgi:hypothetical protein